MRGRPCGDDRAVNWRALPLLVIVFIPGASAGQPAAGRGGGSGIGAPA